MPAKDENLRSNICKGASKPELLAPAGGPEAFAAALAAGADAIYVGMGEFNARRKAENFSDEAFARACRMAHVAGARVYVTVNIVIKEHELVDALNLVRLCVNLGADAFIIQDWGLFFCVRKQMPQVEIHVSTQANIHDARGAAWCAQAGAQRVTLSRELSVGEIETIAKACPTLELEVFAHGAICFCYSGLCHLSSFCCEGRSANRGLCAQPCRLPYELLDAAGRVVPTPRRDRALCPRDNNTSEMLDKLLDAGVHALKLEGRMKAADYVHSVVDVYRKQLDDVLTGCLPAPEERSSRARQLKRCFNRDFTCAYLTGASGDEMMSYGRSNNRGQEVGRVLGSKIVGSGHTRCPEDRRNRVALVRIQLDEPVGAGDLVEIRHDDDMDGFLAFTALADAAAGEVMEVRIPRSMPKGSRVRVLQSAAAHAAADEALRCTYPRKRGVAVYVKAHLGEPLLVRLTCSDNDALSGCATGVVVEAARTRTVSRSDLAEHVGRMGSSPFEADSFEIELDEGVGLSFSEVHRVRTQACEALEQKILRQWPQGVCGDAKAEQKELPSADNPPCSDVVLTHPSCHDNSSVVAHLKLCVLAPSVKLALAAHSMGAARVYVGVDALNQADVSPDQAHTLRLIPVLDEICRSSDHVRLDPWVQNGGVVAIGNMSELALAATRGAMPELRSCIPVHNAACAVALASAGAAGMWLSPELSLADIEELVPHIAMPVGMSVIGRPRVMTSEHCILQVANSCIHDCLHCTLRTQHLALRNIDGKVLPVQTDLRGRSRLYESQPLDLTPQLGALTAAGVTRFGVDGTLMCEDEFRCAINQLSRAIEAVCASRLPGHRLPGHSSGCLFAEAL